MGWVNICKISISDYFYYIFFFVLLLLLMQSFNYPLNKTHKYLEVIKCKIYSIKYFKRRWAVGLCIKCSNFFCISREIFIKWNLSLTPTCCWCQRFYKTEAFFEVYWKNLFKTSFTNNFFFFYRLLWSMTHQDLNHFKRCSSAVDTKSSHNRWQSSLETDKL